jgi:nitrate reductase gamma subunit
MYDLVRGPLVWVAFGVFIIGTIYQVVRFYALSRKQTTFRLTRPTGGPPKSDEPPVEPVLTFGQRLRLSIAGKNPVMIAVTTVFHVLLVLTPFFVLGHNVLWDLAWGVSPPSFSEAITDVLTLIVIAGGVYFLARRLFMARVRAITSAYDYVVLAIATAPFITGFLAYRHIFDYDTVILLHMLAGEIMLIAIPFTKLVHMPFFFINRFLLVHENTFGAGGSRVWR